MGVDIGLLGRRGGDRGNWYNAHEGVAFSKRVRSGEFWKSSCSAPRLGCLDCDYDDAMGVQGHPVVGRYSGVCLLLSTPHTPTPP